MRLGGRDGRRGQARLDAGRRSFLCSQDGGIDNRHVEGIHARFLEADGGGAVLDEAKIKQLLSVAPALVDIEVEAADKPVDRLLAHKAAAQREEQPRAIADFEATGAGVNQGGENAGNVVGHQGQTRHGIRPVVAVRDHRGGSRSRADWGTGRSRDGRWRCYW
ncbi:hypothetical protein CAOG_009291 [Capsaspora owczarzaki ATCC 30864]|uniref:Uncharacterized protein n=1 Tax=Capsaspora owczarzaki (strain ATCC 30864) TaxID=595528 RepID=A0A0D2WGT9_CAPO3|nr:hypothetical protein CAOG_009291 [Capsaspora owczarzaki ATCC 30864]